MGHAFQANVWREGDWYVAQAVEVELASQGRSEEQALSNLREALELYFEPAPAVCEIDEETLLEPLPEEEYRAPALEGTPTRRNPYVHRLEVEIGAA